MPYFDRFDICAAHEAIEIHYNVGGCLRERPSNQRRREATHVQLHRMGYHSAPTDLDCFDALTENGREIYRKLESRYGFEPAHYFEVTAAGFYGGSDETDDRVLWINAPSLGSVAAAIDGTGATLWPELPNDEATADCIDFTLPEQATELRARLLAFQSNARATPTETPRKTITEAQRANGNES